MLHPLLAFAGLWLLWQPSAVAAPTPDTDFQVAQFKAEVSPLSPQLLARVRQHSWRAGCPTPLEELVRLSLSHWGYDGVVHQGELIVHRDLSTEVVDIFRELFAARFPIEKMRLIDAYAGNDDASMADNNSSAFNCRFIAGRTTFSRHSNGRAIDLNPLHNPYVTRAGVQPAAGRAFLERQPIHPGMILGDGPVVRAFTARGWSWGGAWRSVKDYQHFEKRR